MDTMELEKEAESFNRTILELKLVNIDKDAFTATILLIAPFWN